MLPANLLVGTQTSQGGIIATTVLCVLVMASPIVLSMEIVPYSANFPSSGFSASK